MKAAIEELLKSPQNNLKIFKDGFVVYDQTSSPNDLENVLDEWFRNQATESDGRAHRIDEFCNLVCAALTRPVAQEQLKLPTTSLSCNFLLPVNQVPTIFCTAPDAVARAEWCLHVAGKVNTCFEKSLFIKSNDCRLLTNFFLFFCLAEV